MLNMAKFCCQNPKTLQTTMTWRGEGILYWKKKLFFVSTVLSNTVVTQVSLEISGKMIIRKIL